MAEIPESLKLTETESQILENIKDQARAFHLKQAKAAKARGRKDFPLFPFECSWAFEEQFRENSRAGKKYDVKNRIWLK